MKLLNPSCCSTLTGLSSSSSSSHQNLLTEGNTGSWHCTSELCGCRQAEAQLSLHYRVTKHCCQSSLPRDESFIHQSQNFWVNSLHIPKPCSTELAPNTRQGCTKALLTDLPIFPVWAKVTEGFSTTPAPKKSSKSNYNMY